MLVSFSRYAALVKNLRGVLIIDPNDELAPNILRWLSRRFRYRLVGVPPKVLEGLRSRGLNLTKQLRPLHYPSGSLVDLVRACIDYLGSTDEVLVEGAVLASTYVSPAIAFGEEVIREVTELAIHVVNSKVRLDNQYMKLHLRIADYSILDAYEADIELLRKLWLGHVSPREYVRRKEVEVSKDAKRYWRLTKPDTRGGKLKECNPHPFIAYLDIPAALTRKSEEVIKELTSRFRFDDVGAGLVTVPTVTIPNYVLG